MRPVNSIHCLQVVFMSRQQGWTIVELMIAMTLGLFILLTVTGLLLSSKAAYVVQDQSGHVQETGRYAMEILSRAIRQTGYENWSSEWMPALAATDFSPNVMGMDAMTLKKTTAGLDAPVSASSDVVNGSDILALRFFGDGDAVLNCAGLIVPAATSSADAEQERGWSIFFVAKDSAGEPELRCKYRSKTSWNADAIARGVESFQVLYGIDVDGDGLPDRFINASAVDDLDDGLLLTGVNAVARAADKNRKTYWKRVRSIKFALLIRGSQTARDDALIAEHDLFGAEYANMYAASDKGVRIKEDTLPSAMRNRIRKVFTQTIQLRNDVAGSGA